MVAKALGSTSSNQGVCGRHGGEVTGVTQKLSIYFDRCLTWVNYAARAIGERPWDCDRPGGLQQAQTIDTLPYYAQNSLSG